MTSAPEEQSSSTLVNPLVKMATTALGVALLLNDRRKQKSKQLLDSTHRTSAELIERGTEVDQKLRQSAQSLAERTHTNIEQRLDSGKSAIKNAQQSIEQAADTSRDRLLSISGVATHKDVKDNAKLSHVKALSHQVDTFSDQVRFQHQQQLSELAEKANKMDLTPLARSSELTELAKIQDLAPLSKKEDLDILAKSEELAALATKADLELLAQIPILTDKVDTLATREDLTSLAKEQTLKGLQNVIEHQMGSHQARIEMLMGQLATRDDISDLNKSQLTQQDILSATELLASKEDVESVVKQLIKHIHHLERQVLMLKEHLADNEPAPTSRNQLMTELQKSSPLRSKQPATPDVSQTAATKSTPTSNAPAEHGTLAKPTEQQRTSDSLTESIDSVQVRPH
jgi:hypothetical protein